VHLIQFHVCRTIPYPSNPQSANKTKGNCLYFLKARANIDEDAKVFFIIQFSYVSVRNHHSTATSKTEAPFIK
jgi:hypothetical protein